MELKKFLRGYKLKELQDRFDIANNRGDWNRFKFFFVFFIANNIGRAIIAFVLFIAFVWSFTFGIMYGRPLPDLSGLEFKQSICIGKIKDEYNDARSDLIFLKNNRLDVSIDEITEKEREVQELERKRKYLIYKNSKGWSTWQWNLGSLIGIEKVNVEWLRLKYLAPACAPAGTFRM